MPVADEADFKLQRVADFTSTLETLVLGSSRVMALPSTLTGPHSYNMGVSGNFLATQIAQARGVTRIAPHLKTIYISVDWVLGDIFRSSPIPTLSRAPAPVLTANDILGAARDSLALPRVRGLLEPFLRDLLDGRSPELFYALRGGVRPTICPDGSLAANFGFPGNFACPGFREDGSVPFEFRGTLKETSAPSVIQGALIPSAIGPESLGLTHGRANPLYLEAVADLNRTISREGGKMVVLVPPLFPGLKRAISDAPGLGDELATFDNEIAEWARWNDIILIDAAASESRGCVAGDFIDGYHATRSCYAKILSAEGKVRTSE